MPKTIKAVVVSLLLGTAAIGAVAAVGTTASAPTNVSASVAVSAVVHPDFIPPAHGPIDMTWGQNP